jgi:hypothetical protein
MLRIAALAVFLFVLPAGANAFDPAAAASEWAEARGNCRMGETREGRILSGDELDAVCAHADALAVSFLRNGYCFDRSEQEWVLCEPGRAVASPMQREADEWWHMNHVCQMGEASDDRELSAEEIQQACEARDQLFTVLQRNGYCYDNIELEMVLCAAITPD